MKAVVCTAHGPPETLMILEVDDPVAGEGQLLVDVKAAGVNFPDVLIIQNKYQHKPTLPFSPGAEAAGIVSAIGPGVSGFRVGDRVLAHLTHGGFAEKIAMDASRAFKLPEGFDFVKASAFLLTYGTTHHAFKDRAHLRPGENVLVLGAAGGTGLSAVDLGKAMGARVIAAASSEEKLDIARQYGADETILYPSGPLSRDQQKEFSDQIKTLSGGEGVDVIYDPVGGDYAEPALRAIAWDGRFLVIGFAAGDIPRIPLNLALLKGCQIVGVSWGAFARRFPERNNENLSELIDLLASGKINPLVSKTYPLEEVPKALEDMMNRRVKGNIVIVP